MSKTMPQIIMIQHAAWLNKKRMDALVRRGREEGSPVMEDRVAQELFNGKPIDQLTSDEYIAYHASGLM
jgi:hypothetical protein